MLKVLHLTGQSLDAVSYGKTPPYWSECNLTKTGDGMEKSKDLKQGFNPHSPDCELSITEKAQYKTNAYYPIGWEDTVIPRGTSITGHMFLEDKGALDKQVDGDHYKKMKLQPIEFIVANQIPYREANVIKYTCRHASKNGKKDIEKAIHYLQMILEDYE